MRPCIFHVDSHKQLRLIIPQQYIVTWHIALNHLALKKQRIDLTLSLNPIGIVYLGDECTGFYIHIAGTLEILSDAVL
ncbi:hypothetical protein D3C84_1046870 [compost metagenome]